MNIAYFQLLLQEAIDNATGTTDYLLLSKAVQALGVGQIRAVSTFANLPSAAANEGLLVWVDADERLYWSTGTVWVQITAESAGGSVYTWGCNVNGQLGDGTVVSRSSPVSVVGGFTDWCQVDAGSRRTMAVRTNGTLWAWGFNIDGELGDGTNTNKSSPVSVIGGFTDWCQVSAGTTHTAAVRTNGTIWTWGNNSYGRLGDNTVVTKSSPVSVVGGFTDWCQVSTTSSHNLAIRTNGTIWGWGSNYGRLGDGTGTNRSSPVSVVGGFTDWCQVSAGQFHSLAVRSNGTAWAWGSNTNGRLGDTTLTTRSSPVSVAGFTDWCQVSAGCDHSLGIRKNGTLWGWGAGGNGQIGNGTNTATVASPVSVVGGFTDWCQTSAGGFHSLGVRSNGTAWAWGLNTSGTLGNNTGSTASSPTLVAGGFTDWCQVSAGYLLSAGIRRCGFV